MEAALARARLERSFSMGHLVIFMGVGVACNFSAEEAATMSLLRQTPVVVGLGQVFIHLCITFVDKVLIFLAQLSLAFHASTSTSNPWLQE